MPLVVVDRSSVRPGGLARLQAAMAELVAFVEAHEPRVVSYAVHFDERGESMTVVQVHPDPASMEAHLDAAAHLFPPLAGLVVLETMDVYGTPSPALRERLERKAKMLGTAKLAVHPLHAGTFRLPSR